MIFLSKEDKETWEKYKLNMHKLRIDIKKIETNSYNKNLNQSFQKNNKKNYILNNTFDKFLKLLNKNKIEPDGIIDLHGFNLIEAKLKLKNYVFHDIHDLLISNNFKQIYKYKMPFRKTFEYVYEKKKELINSR